MTGKYFNIYMRSYVDIPGYQSRNCPSRIALRMGLAGRFCEVETAVKALFTGRGPALTSGGGDFLFVAKMLPGPGGDSARSVV